MSTTSIPIESDNTWVKNLKNGDVLYTSEYLSDTNRAVVHKLVFDHYVDSLTPEDKDSVWAQLHAFNAAEVPIEPVDISYGYFISPLASLEAFKNTMEIIIKGISISIEEEKFRLQNGENK